MRVKIAGGNSGHNGLKSIDESIGKQYKRLRLGVGRPENKEFSTADYVLGRFTSEEKKMLENINQKISKNVLSLLEGKDDEFLNKFYLV